MSYIPGKIVGHLLTFASNIEFRTGTCPDQALCQLSSEGKVAISVKILMQKKKKKEFHVDSWELTILLRFFLRHFYLCIACGT